jgi:hypothetical protein
MLLKRKKKFLYKIMFPPNICSQCSHTNVWGESTVSYMLAESFAQSNSKERKINCSKNCNSQVHWMVLEVGSSYLISWQEISPSTLELFVKVIALLSPSCTHHLMMLLPPPGSCSCCSQSNEILSNKGMKCWDSSLNARGSLSLSHI